MRRVGGAAGCGWNTQTHPLVLPRFPEHLRWGAPACRHGDTRGDSPGRPHFHGMEVLEGRQPVRSVAEPTLVLERARETDWAGARLGGDGDIL